MTKTGALALGILVLAAYAAQAQISDNVVRIGVLNDQSGVFADFTGPGSVVAAKMAAADFGDKVAGARIEIISADHLNKPDVGSSIAREWFDEKGVDAIADLGNSAVALAVQEVAKTRNKAILLSAGGSTAFTGKACTPITVQWTYDTWASANAIAAPLVKSGKDTWFFITADYTFGHDLERLEPVDRRGQWRQGRRRRDAPAQHRGFRLLCPASPGLEGEGRSLRQWRRRYLARHQAGA